MLRIVIFANGELDQPHLLRRRLQPTDRIFCADGGARHAAALGLTPELVVGDLDSLPPELVHRFQQAGAVIERHPPRKDQTDLELTLDRAMAQQPSEIMLVTALGGRLDQMLANILLLTRPAYAAARLTLADGPQWAVLLRGGQRTTVSGRPGDTVSVVPLSAQVAGVTLTGVAWPLHRATLQLGSTWSISNALTGPEAVIEISGGLALVVHIGQEGK
jgi:thiamine pyrophosphokinase